MIVTEEMQKEYDAIPTVDINGQIILDQEYLVMQIIQNKIEIRNLKAYAESMKDYGR